MKLIIILLLIIMMPFSALSETYWAICNKSSSVNIRERPDVGEDIVGYLEFGDTIDIISIKKNWGYSNTIGNESGEGYVSMTYLSRTEPLEVNATYVTNKGKVFLRRAPNEEKLAKLKKGKELFVYYIITDQNEIEWAQVDGGYIMLKFLTKIEGDTIVLETRQPEELDIVLFPN